MARVSIVIITKNEQDNIAGCILAARKLGNDIIVIDTGSNDATIDILRLHGINYRSVTWTGYGAARNQGAALAQSDWILALDADERITDELAQCILKLDLLQADCIYGFRRLNYFGSSEINYGAPGNDRVYRLYNRKHTQWNADPVHEKLIETNTARVTLKPLLKHYGIKNAEHYQHKKMNYAGLCALKYRQNGKRANPFLRLCSPVFNFVKAYFFQFGFLDGRRGFLIAKINAIYTWHKYDQLYKMKQVKNESKEPAIKTSWKRIY